MTQVIPDSSLQLIFNGLSSKCMSNSHSPLQNPYASESEIEQFCKNPLMIMGFNWV